MHPVAALAFVDEMEKIAAPPFANVGTTGNSALLGGINGALFGAYGASPSLSEFKGMDLEQIKEKLKGMLKAGAKGAVSGAVIGAMASKIYKALHG